ncbi:DNA-binding response regulator [Flavipsychrobacter stenotrophus]|uniref:DNA-binding response regulator n=1 Tax=Flavipsychrobacter stenotrophus TaxID=2077091 RepID=A0A2S7SWQ9_9BACT|nr:LytTR family DNA-binding domain-containing protein [Flavipsychrobacter stenotrophus]PQJ11047.1 DNA-binding response regulator [Flavipsychrobacter stenotrophus]
MIQALIVEDEQYSRDILEGLLSKYSPQVEILDYACDANEAVEKIEALNPELVFMDIELPYGNAFDILARLKDISFHIVFTTAYDEYILKALKAGATDYLLKPLDHAELTETIARVEKKIGEKKKYANIEQLLAAFSKQFNTNTLALPTMDGYNFIKFEDIIRVEADGNYCKIFCLNKQSYTVTRQIHEIEEKLPAVAFSRIHNSHIVNVGFVREYIKGRGGYVIMSDGSQVDVSNRRKDQFLERLL